MPVAKSYKNLKQLVEPFKDINGRLYVIVETAKGLRKKVRWYSEAEYKKLYPEEAIADEEQSFNHKIALGFQKGYITIFKGDQDLYEDWFKFSNARWCRHWGWYIVSTEEIPYNLPFGIEAIKLYWKDISKNGKIKSDNEIKQIVDSLMFGESDSIHVGFIGERLNLELTISRVIPLDSVYGRTLMHIMHDDCGNEFVWVTAAKELKPEKQYKMKGTVKEHKTYRGINQTILTRCSVER